jgi:hypothetical protein
MAINKSVSKVTFLFTIFDSFLLLTYTNIYLFIYMYINIYIYRNNMKQFIALHSIYTKYLQPYLQSIIQRNNNHNHNNMIIYPMIFERCLGLTGCYIFYTSTLPIYVIARKTFYQYCQQTIQQRKLQQQSINNKKNDKNHKKQKSMKKIKLNWKYIDDDILNILSFIDCYYQVFHLDDGHVSDINILIILLSF